MRTAGRPIRFSAASKSAGSEISAKSVVGISEASKQTLFAEAILCFFERERGRMYGHAFGQETRGLHRNVFELVGDQFQAVRKFLEGLLVGELGADALGDPAHRRFRRWIEETKMQAKGITGERQHVARVGHRRGCLWSCALLPLLRLQR